MNMINPIALPSIRSKAHLVENLKFVYGLIVATEDLLEAAYQASGDDYFAEKQDQERGHAEWLMKDIRNLGSMIALDHDAACIAGAQFYYIRYVDPRMLLGYMLALEEAPMLLSEINALESMVGPMPTLRFHANHDDDHAADVRGQIARIDSTDLRASIFYNYNSTKAQIAAILSDRFEGCDT